MPPPPGCSPTTDPLRGGGRFALSRPEGLPDVVLKQGDPRALRREAMGARIAAPPRAPRVLWQRGDMLASEWIHGTPRELAGITAADAGALGRLLRQVHGRRASASGGPAAWPSRARGLAGYARRRAADALRGARTDGERELVARAGRQAVAAAPGDAGFAFLHGDLVEANVVWAPAGPVLVDWEFWRMGDPAEDLAYLEALNDLPAAVAAEVRGGYRVGAALARRIDAWRPLVMLDAAGWYRAHGERARAQRLIARAQEHLPA